MEIAIAKETVAQLDKASQVLGLKKTEIVDRAIVVYLDSIQKFLEFKKEIRVWDSLSDEALAGFEKAI